ncbi:RNase H domain-containing protein [Nephila pilipes]|uniref:RNase H domain-containing protein n=1 Tax=Nephila pilipes TaxID=299642 RepID=A0A8X6UK07_NEPPI|nr:RNase H domain-containing protein [Nephila pilipes]
MKPLETSKILYNLDLMIPVLKAQDYCAALCSAEMGTIYNHFPLEAWLHIYTNGSKLEINGVAGAGVYCEHFSHYLLLETAKYAFDGEVEAIKVALTHLNARLPLSDQAIIFSDSQAAILAISNCFHAPIPMSVMQCRSLMGKMPEKYKTIASQWVPSHCGIPDNEKADELAKKDCLVNQIPFNLVTYRSALSMINQMLKTIHMPSLKKRTKEKPWRNDTLNLPDCPRSITEAVFRLTTGHDCLYAHPCRFRVVDVLHARSAAVLLR